MSCKTQVRENSVLLLFCFLSASFGCDSSFVSSQKDKSVSGMNQASKSLSSKSKSQRIIDAEKQPWEREGMKVRKPRKIILRRKRGEVIDDQKISAEETKDARKAYRSFQEKWERETKLMGNDVSPDPKSERYKEMKNRMIAE